MDKKLLSIVENQQIVKMIKERDKLDTGVRYSIDEVKKHRANSKKSVGQKQI